MSDQSASTRRNTAVWLTAVAFVLGSGCSIIGTHAFAQSPEASAAQNSGDRPGEQTVVRPEDGRPVYVARGTGAQVNFPTELNTIVLNAEQTGGNLTLTDEHWLPGDWTNTHYHKSQSETFYVVSGQFDAVVAGRKFTMKAGDAVYLPPHTLHSFAASHEGGGAHALLIVTPAGADPWPLEYKPDGTRLNTH